ncbi:ABC transporter permease [Camelimonas abortus]|uniref:ABC transporter permease n=1 Tax=Camelimonas abortus TaxID=1017184 RepID=A0ABV7LBS0_9HYPH
MRTTAAALAVFLLLSLASLFTGAGPVSPGAVLAGDPAALQLLLASRGPRTIAIILAGGSIAIAGLIMQMLARNRFAEPSTSGAVDAASLGMLCATLLLPEWPVMGKMLVAAGFAMAGSALFLGVLSRIPLSSPLVAPLVGIMLGNVIGAAATFIAYREDMMQTFLVWTNGDFSAVLRGRYELLWVAFAMAAAAWFTADRLTVAGLGHDFSVNLGLSYRATLALGLAIVSLVTAMVVTTVGMIPFLGLVAPNLASLMLGDNMRRAIPLTAALGAGLALACDLLGRIINHPFEIPIGTMMGVIGSVVFLFLLLRRRARVG